MGKGGCSKPVSSVDNEQMYYRVPSDKPPFTLSDIKKAIPPHCFKRSLIRSLSYPIFDLIVCFLLYYVAVNYIHLLPKPLTYVAWTAYAYIQGCYMVGLWVIAHDCGHNAFSNYHWVNDTVGFILHTIILVPYFSFKISHRHHHANTCLIDRDENHVPMFEHNLRPHYHLIKNPIGRVIVIAIHLLLGMPFYMLFNISGHKYDRWTSHFNPYSPMYTKNERALVIFSDLGFLAMCYLSYRIALVKGFSFIMLTYGAPILVMCAFLVLLGLLQHNHVSLPHYDTTEWDWLKGALATIDRDYGFLNHVFHHLTDSHVLHHLIPTIPHYHGLEATEAMKPVLGDYYFYDGTPFYKALWRETKECVYVQAEQEGDKVKGVYWYKTKPSVKSD